MHDTRMVAVPTEEWAASSGIDTVESVREALGAMRAGVMQRLPEGIRATLVLSHALWWLSHLAPPTLPDSVEARR